MSSFSALAWLLGRWKLFTYREFQKQLKPEEFYSELAEIYRL